MLRVFASLTPHLDEPCRQLPGQKVFCGFPPWRPHVIWADSRFPVAAVWLVDWTFSELGLQWETGNKYCKWNYIYIYILVSGKHDKACLEDWQLNNSDQLFSWFVSWPIHNFLVPGVLTCQRHGLHPLQLSGRSLFVFDLNNAISEGRMSSLKMVVT